MVVPVAPRVTHHRRIVRVCGAIPRTACVLALESAPYPRRRDGASMRVHVIRQVPFEGPAAIAEWAAERGHEVTESLALLEEFPDPADVDFLVLMGGPMAADDEAANPWLHAEKRFAAAVIAAGRPVLGVCLGAQILAEVIGGTVRRNDVAEIGWYPGGAHRRGCVRAAVLGVGRTGDGGSLARRHLRPPRRHRVVALERGLREPGVRVRRPCRGPAVPPRVDRSVARGPDRQLLGRAGGARTVSHVGRPDRRGRHAVPGGLPGAALRAARRPGVRGRRRSGGWWRCERLGGTLDHRRPRPREALRGVHGRRRGLVRHRGGLDLWAAGTQRRRQDHDDLDGVVPDRARRRRRARRRPLGAERLHRGPARAGRGAPGDRAVPHALGRREPAVLGPHVRAARQRARRGGRVRAGDGGPRGAGQASGSRPSREA